MMAEGGYRHLPIVDQDQKPTGVLAVHGIVHYLVDHFPETVYNLPPDTEGGPSTRRSINAAASNGGNHCRSAKTFNNNESRVPAGGLPPRKRNQQTPAAWIESGT